MGKKRRKRQKKYKKPDELYVEGPIAIARYGKIVTMQNLAAPSDHEKLHKQLADRFPDFHAEIDSTVQSLREMLIQYSPIELLARAFYGASIPTLGIFAESELPIEAIQARNALEYIQAILVSSQPIDEQSRTELDDKSWGKITAEIEKLYGSLLPWYQLYRHAYLKEKNLARPEGLEEFSALSQIFWCGVRGNRYTNHELPHLMNFLLPHNDLLIESYGISANEIVEGLAKILNLLTRGIFEPYEKLSEMHEKFKEWSDSKDWTQSAETSVMQEFITDTFDEDEFEQIRERITSQLMHHSIFEISTTSNFPKTLLNDLSLSLGEDHEFFKKGEYAGWPLREWPTWRRPFLRLGEQYYCFNYYTVFDNIYRSIQRCITANRPEHVEKWNIRQSETSERVATRSGLKIA